MHSSRSLKRDKNVGVIEPKQRRPATTEIPNLTLLELDGCKDHKQTRKSAPCYPCTHTESMQFTRHPRNLKKFTSNPDPINVCQLENEPKSNKTRRHSISDVIITKAKSLSRRIHKHMLNTVFLFHEDVYGVSWTTAHNMLAGDAYLDKSGKYATHLPTQDVSPSTRRRTRLYVLDRPAREQIHHLQPTYVKSHSVGANFHPHNPQNESINNLSPTILRNIEKELNKRHGSTKLPSNLQCQQDESMNSSNSENNRSSIQVNNRTFQDKHICPMNFDPLRDMPRSNNSSHMTNRIGRHSLNNACRVSDTLKSNMYKNNSISNPTSVRNIRRRKNGVCLENELKGDDCETRAHFDENQRCSSHRYHRSFHFRGPTCFQPENNKPCMLSRSYSDKGVYKDFNRVPGNDMGLLRKQDSESYELRALFSKLCTVHAKN